MAACVFCTLECTPRVASLHCGYALASSALCAAACAQVPVKEVVTKPIDGQKTGTSGLRKKTAEFMSNNYLANWVQSLFNALGAEVVGKTLLLGGDGRCVACAAGCPQVCLALPLLDRVWVTGLEICLLVCWVAHCRCCRHAAAALLGSVLNRTPPAPHCLCQLSVRPSRVLCGE
jgi:Phosphoglucomutase/phosphomannomutase, alpha/beta/alpha domain I